MDRLTTRQSPPNGQQVYRRGDNHLVVSGPEVVDSTIPLDQGERAVEIPTILILDAVTQLGGATTWTDVQRMFDNFAESAFRVETLDFYAVESDLEALEHFQSTGELIHGEASGAWDRMVADHLAAGRTMRRIHTVRLPLTDYLRWELTSHSRDSRESIRVLDLDQHQELANVEEMGDAWIFDERVGVRLCYDEDGAMTHQERLDDQELEQYLAWRDRAWEVAVPVAEFLAEVG